MRSGIQFSYLVVILSSLLIFTGGARADWALAFGQGFGGGWGAGWDLNKSDLELAQSIAMAGCKQKTSGCRLVAYGGNGCVALAVARQSNGYGYARRDSLGAALAHAMSICVSSNPAGCEVKAQFCDRSHGFKEANTSDVDRQLLRSSVERGNLYRDQQRVLHWQQNGQIFNSFIDAMRGTTRPSPGYRPGPVPPRPPQGSGNTNCPGATIAVDENCRPLH